MSSMRWWEVYAPAGIGFCDSRTLMPGLVPQQHPYKPDPKYVCAPRSPGLTPSRSRGKRRRSAWPSKKRLGWPTFNTRWRSVASVPCHRRSGWRPRCPSTGGASPSAAGTLRTRCGRGRRVRFVWGDSCGSGYATEVVRQRVLAEGQSAPVSHHLPPTRPFPTRS